MAIIVDKWDTSRLNMTQEEIDAEVEAGKILLAKTCRAMDWDAIREAMGSAEEAFAKQLEGILNSPAWDEIED